jgi:hypothetical protein
MRGRVSIGAKGRRDIRCRPAKVSDLGIRHGLERTYSVQEMISHTYQRIQMVRETQDWRKRASSIWKLSSSFILNSEKRVQRVFDRYNVVCGHYHARDCNSHIYARS